jgi:hypothetical protein
VFDWLSLCAWWARWACCQYLFFKTGLLASPGLEGMAFLRTELTATPTLAPMPAAVAVPAPTPTAHKAARPKEWRAEADPVEAGAPDLQIHHFCVALPHVERYMASSEIEAHRLFPEGPNHPVTAVTYGTSTDGQTDRRRER